jgi:hypothetical protein
MKSKKKSKEPKRWKNANGNMCFSIPEHRFFEKPWIMIIAAIFAAVICAVEYFFWGSYRLLVPLSILLFFFLIWWLDIPARRNEEIIVRMVHKLMDDGVKGDISKLGRSMVRMLVNHDYKGTYGVVESSCLLVLLDNDEVWEYPLVYHRSDDCGEFFECERTHIVCENKKHIRKISPKLWKRFAGMFKLSDKAWLSLLLLTILLVGGLCVAVFFWVLDHFMWWYLLGFVAFVVLCGIVVWCQKKWPCKVLNFISAILSVPFAILYIFFHIGIPFLTIVATYFFLVLFAFGIPAMLLVVFTEQGLIALHVETIAFAVLTLGSILCSNSYKLTKWIIHMTPLRDWGNHRYESYREQLAYYLIHPSNVTFLLYLIYLVYLAISGFLQIEKVDYLISEGFDTAILKAFLVFIAFTNMKAKSKEAEIDVKELTKKTMLLFVHDDE